VASEGSLEGHNTDARGLELALQHEGLWPSPGAAVVVLGAGGAAAAAVLALARSQPAAITVAARRPRAAHTLAESAADLYEKHTASWDVAAVGDALRQAGTAVLVNATPAPLADLPVDLAQLPDGCTVIDLRYRPRPVDLVAAARARGLRATDGLEMLLQQGMLSFALWTGMEPPTGVARMALREAVGA